MSTPNDPPNPYGGTPEEPQQPGVPQDPSAPQYPYGTPPPPPQAPPAPQYGSPQYGSPQYGAAPQYGASPYQYGVPQGPPPNNYLVWAILVTVLCCLPLGIASIVFSSQVNSKWAQGDFAGAQIASTRARQFAMWGAIAGAVVIVAYIALVVVGASLGSNSGY